MLTPELAWTPLPEDEWTHQAARHLASRMGFSVNPAIVERVEELGPEGTVRTFLDNMTPLPAPGTILEIKEESAEYSSMMKEADRTEKRELRQAFQKQNRISYQQYAIDWYTFARKPHNSPQEKLVLFFEDVWVVAFSGVRNAPALYDYQSRIRKNLGGTYPELCRKLAKSPAMIRYLNLNQSSKQSPNENFARELFELFCLGRGNYSEDDIKEAARAMTGWTVNPQQQVTFRPRRHDTSAKTIFGETGNFGMDDVIDLVFQQTAAASFLPGELARFYLTEGGLSGEMLQPLAESWRESGFSIPYLIKTFFTSRIFYESGFRGNMIKAPVHYYLGLLQDLDLDVFPSARRTNNLLRRMGQQFFNPPNVRGWVGGRNWINSATLAARRQLAQSVLHPVPLEKLNADEQDAVARAKAMDRDNFTITEDQIQAIAATDANELAHSMARRLFVEPDPEPLKTLYEELGNTLKGRRLAIASLNAAFNSPAYHLC